MNAAARPLEPRSARRKSDCLTIKPTPPFPFFADSRSEIEFGQFERMCKLNMSTSKKQKNKVSSKTGKIMVSKDGPYLVSGALPLAKAEIVNDEAGDALTGMLIKSLQFLIPMLFVVVASPKISLFAMERMPA